MKIFTAHYLSHHIYSRLMFNVTIGLLLAPLIWFMERAFYALSNPGELDYGEGIVLYLVRLFAERGNYFLDISSQPFTLGVYPPVFLIASLPVYWFIGPDLFGIRLVSTLATIGVLIFLYLVVYELTARKRLALICTMMFAALPIVQGWAVLGRVDFLGLLFVLIGWFVWLRGNRNQTRARYWSFLFFGLAAFTKHSFILAPVAIIVSMLWDQHGRHEILRYLFAWLAPITLGLVIATWLTEGRFLTHLGPYMALPLLKARALNGYLHFFTLLFIFLSTIDIALLVVGQEFWQKHRAWLIYMILLLVSIATIGKIGSNYNYLLEPALATIILFAITVGLLEDLGRRFSLWIPALLQFMLLVQAASLVYVVHPKLLELRDEPLNKNAAGVIDQYVLLSTGPILSENVSVLTRYGREVTVLPFEFTSLARLGYWDGQSLMARCQAGDFELILAGESISALPGMSGCLESTYDLRGILTGGIQVYKPKVSIRENI